VEATNKSKTAGYQKDTLLFFREIICGIFQKRLDKVKKICGEAS